MDIYTFHLYNRLARRGFCKPLVCQHCNTGLTIMLGEEDTPTLKCFGCGVLTYPGLDMYSRIRAVVMEHYDER